MQQLGTCKKNTEGKVTLLIPKQSLLAKKKLTPNYHGPVISPQNMMKWAQASTHCTVAALIPLCNVNKMPQAKHKNINNSEVVFIFSNKCTKRIECIYSFWQIVNEDDHPAKWSQLLLTKSEIIFYRIELKSKSFMTKGYPYIKRYCEQHNWKENPTILYNGSSATIFVKIIQKSACKLKTLRLHTSMTSLKCPIIRERKQEKHNLAFSLPSPQFFAHCKKYFKRQS